ncbi:hypothetical protein AJ80_00167 [Polytolypa hystricis UAMH7299]|uniref:GAT domain-containing protein n=1 Tax=Polytolypa hystricis (strain UAMH7299) TaxID=1447883 RepID=A0A2B7Z2Z3_POLH7|nr:hypothetical protein AJ80_00167 [Polytolypa hystricis UAMH7299]
MGVIFVLQGDEYLHLPAIVEAAESTPGAAKEAAHRIRQLLSNPATRHGYKQYNAIMLVRILADNPGPSFTRNLDEKFVATVKTLLRDGRDMGVQQMLRETLESLSAQKAYDTNLTPLLEMWKKEKGKLEKKMGVSAGPWVPPQQPPSQRDDYFARQHRTRSLPSAEELAARIAEASTSAKLLNQVVQSTPPAEFHGNDLLKEFAGRCQSASRSIQRYINSTNPAPDEDTMLTLIDTNDRLSVALSKYQRAAVIARKNMRTTESQEQISTPQQQPEHGRKQATSNITPVEETKSSVPILSLPRKALNKFRSLDRAPAEASPPTTTAPQAAPTSTFAPTLDPQSDYQRQGAFASGRGDVSPLEETPPALPPLISTTPATTTTAARSNGNGISGGYQYNSSDFQVENPFADKYSTTADTTQTSTTNVPAGGDSYAATGSTYQPLSGVSLYDTNSSSLRGPDATSGFR